MLIFVFFFFFFPFFFSFFFFFTLRPSKQFCSHVGTEPPLPWYYKYFWKVNVSCSRTQHGDLSEDRAPDLSLRSPCADLDEKLEEVILVHRYDLFLLKSGGPDSTADRSNKSRLTYVFSHFHWVFYTFSLNLRHKCCQTFILVSRPNCQRH